MKKLITTCVSMMTGLVLFMSCQSEKTDWKLVWEENFEQTDSFDPAVWSKIPRGTSDWDRHMSDFDSCYAMRDGKLILRGLVNYTQKNDTSPVLTGGVYSKGKKLFEHGRLEINARLHGARGAWPAFWLLGDDYTSVGWPRCGEIDIVEMGHADGIKSSTQSRYFNGACHWGVSHTDVKHYVQNATAEYSLQDDKFHLFTVEWDEQSIKMYLDQDLNPNVAPYFIAPIDDKSTPDAPGYFFHKPFFILFNLAVGGEFTGIEQIEDVTALSGGEAKMYVDYVRVYRRGNSVQATNEMTYQK